MGSTPRERLTQLPLPTRSSEASAECFGRVVLSYLREDEQADASFFVLGDLLHRGIEDAITRDLDLAYMATTWIDVEMEKIMDKGIGHPRSGPSIESSQRGWDTLFDDYQRMMKQWFTKVHPDSDKRHPIYDPYQWPPVVEQEFHRTARSAGTKYAVWGSIDALFLIKGQSWDRLKQLGRGLLLIDWKSGTQKQKSDFQLDFYRFGMAVPSAEAAFHHLDRVQNRSIIQEAAPYPGDDEIIEAILLTERRKDAVVAGRVPRFVPDWYCGYCPVQHLCPADGDPRNRDENLTQLKKLLSSVEAMTEIPSSIEGGTPIGRV